MTTYIDIRCRKIIRFLTIIVWFLVLAGLASVVLRLVMGYPTAFGFVQKFDLNDECNVPSYFGALLLLLASLLLSVIAAIKTGQKAAFANHWKLLALIFLYLSLDEATAIHEMVGRQIRRVFAPEGIFHFTWVIPGTILVLFVAFFFRSFLFSLPMKTRRLFLIAAALYIGGALALEFIEGYYFVPLGNLTLSLLSVVEETLEMIGMLLFVHALFDYLSSSVGSLELRFQASKTA